MELWKGTEEPDPHRPASVLIMILTVGFFFMFLFGLWVGKIWAG